MSSASTEKIREIYYAISKLADGQADDDFMGACVAIIVCSVAVIAKDNNERRLELYRQVDEAIRIGLGMTRVYTSADHPDHPTRQ